MRSLVFIFETQAYIEIEGTKFYAPPIDTILSSNFTVKLSNESYRRNRFALKWSCLNWGDWTPTGACTEVRSLQPEYNGTDIRYRTKYRKTNETCCKFSFVTMSITRICNKVRFYNFIYIEYLFIVTNSTTRTTTINVATTTIRSMENTRRDRTRRDRTRVIP